MPKVTLGTSSNDKQSVLSVIKEFAGKALMEMPELAKRCGIPKATFYLRLREPDTFRRWELKEICRVLKIPEERRGELL